MTTVNLVLGFPGVGKTTLFNNYIGSKDYLILDSDSSKFPKDAFPGNYIDHIQATLSDERNSSFKAVIVLCSTHEAVREELDARGIEYTIVYPSVNNKEEYIKRYTDRGSPQAFVDLLNRMWDQWVKELEVYPAKRKFRLLEKQTLTDLIRFFGIN